MYPEYARSMVASILIRRIALGMSYTGHCVGMVADAWPMEMWRLFSPTELEADFLVVVIV